MRSICVAHLLLRTKDQGAMYEQTPLQGKRSMTCCNVPFGLLSIAFVPGVPASTPFGGTPTEQLSI